MFVLPWECPCSLAGFFLCFLAHFPRAVVTLYHPWFCHRHTRGFGASALSDGCRRVVGWLVGDALPPVPAAAQLLVPHLPHPVTTTQKDLPLSPSEPLVSFSASPQPCEPPQLPAASSTSSASPGAVWAQGSEPRVLPSLFCSSHVSPSSGGIQLHPLGYCTKSPAKRVY